MPRGLYGTTIPEASIHVDSLAATCGSKSAMIKWATSEFEQRDEKVILKCHPCESDEGSEEAFVTFRAYAYCMKHETSEGKNCPVRWRVYGVAGIGSSGTMHIDRCGKIGPAGLAVMIQHAETPRIVKGMQTGEKKKLKATGVETPLRSLAHLCEDAGDDGEKAALIPPVESLRGQRKKYLRESCSDGNRSVNVSTSRILWKRFVTSIAFDEEQWKVAQPFRLFSVTIDEVDAPPICLLVCKAFLHYIQTWKNTRKSGAVCGDTTWKLNVAEWGLFVFAGMATHFVPKDGHRRCMALPFSMTFGPKEDIPTLDWAIKGTFAFYEKRCGVSLKRSINVVMWDGTPAGAAVHKKGGALAGVDYARDLRHQLSNARAKAPSKCQGDLETKTKAALTVIGSIPFSGFNLWTGALFHDHWEHVMTRLIADDQNDLVKWVQKHVLFWNYKTSLWDADWRTALMSKRHPAESTYLPQVLESLHDTIKDALPRSIRFQEPSAAITKLGYALEAVARSREWTTPATGQNSSQKWVFTERLGKEIEKYTYKPGSFSPQIVHGPRKRSERLTTEDDEQWYKLTLNALVQHTPDNVKSVSVNASEVKELYVVPLFEEQLAITDDIIAAATQLLFPDSQDAFEAAKEAMRITISDAGTQRYSFSGSRLFFNNICPVLVKTDGCIVCGCQDGRVYGECAHENYVRYVKLDFLKDEFAPKRNPRISRGPRGRSPGRSIDVPAKAARMTIEDIREGNEQRRRKREAVKGEKVSFRKCMLRRAFNSPDRESQEQVRKKAKTEISQRAKNMQCIKDGLEHIGEVYEVTKALRLCMDSKLGLMDAKNKKYRIGKQVGIIAKDDSLPRSVTAMARKLIDTWSAEASVIRSQPALG